MNLSRYPFPVNVALKSFSFLLKLPWSAQVLFVLLPRHPIMLCLVLRG
jgi:hypothetical protein